MAGLKVTPYNLDVGAVFMQVEHLDQLFPHSLETFGLFKLFKAFLKRGNY